MIGSLRLFSCPEPRALLIGIYFRKDFLILAMFNAEGLQIHGFVGNFAPEINVEYMKRPFAILLLLCCLGCAWGQRRVTLIDDQTGNPVVKAVVGNAGEELGYTDQRGQFVVMPQVGEVIFAHEVYDRAVFDYEALPDTIVMIRRTFMLDEVEVNGHAGLKVNPNAVSMGFGGTKTDRELQSIDPGGGANLLGLAVWGVSKLLKLDHGGKSKKERKRERLQRILDSATP